MLVDPRLHLEFRLTPLIAMLGVHCGHANEMAPREIPGQDAMSLQARTGSSR